MDALKRKIAELEALKNPSYLLSIWEQAILDLAPFMLELLKEQHAESIDGDDNSLGTYVHATEVEKKKTNTWQGPEVVLYNFGDWSESLYIVIENNEIIFKGLPEERTKYLTGESGEWKQGRPAAMELTEDNKAIVITQVKEIMLMRFKV